jgi:hypothetical protein
MTVISLVEDGDLDLQNNYTTSESYSQFSAPGRRRPGFRGIPVSYPLQPTGHVAIQMTDDGEVWSPKHGLGLPVLVAPGWLLGQALTPWLADLTTQAGGGWPGAVLEMSVIGALLATQTFVLAWEISGRRTIALAVWAALSFSVPQVLVSLMIFPETPAALGLIYAFRHLVVRRLPEQSWRLLLVGLVIAGLPWLNPRFVLVSGCLTVLALAAVWRWSVAGEAPPPGPLPTAVERGRSLSPLPSPSQWGGVGGGASSSVLRKAGLLLGLLPISALAFLWHSLGQFGSAVAVAGQYEGFFVPTIVDGHLAADWHALLLSTAGLFVDRQYGLLAFAPVYALAGAGFLALWQQPDRRWTVLALALVAVPYFLLTADFRVWWGGWSPPARYLAVLTPLLAAPLAQALRTLTGSRLHWTMFAALAGVGILVTIGLLAQLGYPEVEQAIFANPSRNPAALRWLLLRFGLDLTLLLPSTAPWFGDRRGPVPWLHIAACFALLGLLIGLAIRSFPPIRGLSAATVIRHTPKCKAGTSLSAALCACVVTSSRLRPSPVPSQPASHADTPR